MNCIIIEDDVLNLRMFEEYVKITKGLTLIASFSSAHEALKNSSTFETIDIIFLDVELPGMSGFDFIKSIDIEPCIVIMSSNVNYAVEAFTVEVSDFLLKPITYPRFVKACNKVEHLISEKKTVTQQSTEDSLFLKKNGKSYNVKYEDISHIEALENYAVFYTKQDNYTLHYTMKTLENKLPNQLFKRIHRSYIVNMKKVIKMSDSEMIVGYDEVSAITVPIGRNFKKNVFKSILAL